MVQSRPCLAGAARRATGARCDTWMRPTGGVVGSGLTDAVQRAKGGEIEFKANKEGIVIGPVGKVTWTCKQLQENANQFM